MHHLATEARGTSDSRSTVILIISRDCCVFTMKTYISNYWLDFKKYHLWNSPVTLQSMNLTGRRTQSSAVTASLKTVLDSVARVICFKCYLKNSKIPGQILLQNLQEAFVIQFMLFFPLDTPFIVFSLSGPKQEAQVSNKYPGMAKAQNHRPASPAHHCQISKSNNRGRITCVVTISIFRICKASFHGIWCLALYFSHGFMK